MLSRQQLPLRLRVLRSLSRALARLPLRRGLLVRLLLTIAPPRNLGQREFSVTTNGHSYAGTLANWIDWNVFFLGEYEGDLIRAIRTIPLDKEGTFVDVGANSGIYTMAFADSFLRTVAIEPSPPEVVRLRQNLAANEVDTVIVEECALGSARSTAKLHLAPHQNTGRSTLHRSRLSEHCQAIDVRVETGDSLLSRSPIPPVSLLKIDTEGHELEVLRGLSQTIRRDRPVIVAEVSAPASITDVLDLAEGYRAYIAEPLRFLGLIEQRRANLRPAFSSGSVTSHERTVVLVPDPRP